MEQNWAKALKVFKESLAQSKKSLGLEHPNTLTSMNNIGNTLKRTQSI